MFIVAAPSAIAAQYGRVDEQQDAQHRRAEHDPGEVVAVSPDEWRRPLRPVHTRMSTRDGAEISPRSAAAM